jgi:peptide/nickel transport system substrate-binding protein
MKKGILILGIVVLLLITLIACGAPSVKVLTSNATAATTPTAKPDALETPTLTPKSGGVLKIVPRFTSQVFGYPGDMSISAASEISSPCLESLCGVNTSGEFMPTRLSTAYQVAPDGKSVTFTLRKGVKFHDGTDFNAAAAKWNLEQMKKARATGTDQWTTIDAVDDYKVRVNVKVYQNTFIGQLASISRISSPAAFEKYGIDKIHTQPVGTGPFKFVSFTPDVGIIWERNDDYWGGKPYLDRIETLFIKDDMAKSAALQSKGVDVLFNVTSETGIALREKGYNVTVAGQEMLVCMLPDSINADSLLSNQKVREAIEYAIDRDALKELGNGFWTATYQPCTPNTPGFVPDFKGRQYDPVKAKQLLTEAGYPNGFNINIIFAITPAVTPMDTMTAMQQFLSKVGINADLQQVTSNQRSEYSMKGWNNGFVNVGIFSSLNYISGLQYTVNPGGNLYISTAKPAELGELLNQAAAEMDMAKVAQLSQKINMTLYDNATLIPLWVAPQQLYVQQNYVHDAGLFLTGSQFEWTPEKAWINE